MGYVSLDAKILTAEYGELGAYPLLPDDWTRRTSAALLLYGCALQDPSRDDITQTALQLARLDKRFPIEAAVAKSIVETAARYLKDQILKGKNIRKKLFAVGEHAKLVLEVDESQMIHRLYSSMENLAIETGNLTEVNELFANALDRMIVPAVRAGVISARLVPPSRKSGLGLTYDRLISRTSKYRGGGPETFEWIKSSIVEHFEVIEKAYLARPFDNDEVLINWSKESCVLTSKCFYFCEQIETPFLLDEIIGYRSRRRLLAWPPLSYQALLDLKNGEQIVFNVGLSIRCSH